MNNDIIISQSFIKAMNKGRHPEELTARDNPRCPAKAHAIYIEGRHSPSTDAMLKGNYFEMLVYGGTEEGGEYQMKRTSTGAKTVEQTRVENQANKFLTAIKTRKRMNLIRPREHILVRIAEGIMFRARLDVVTSFLDDQGQYHEEIILDTKVTDNILSSYGEFSWGDPINMDHTQAAAYSWAFERKYKKRVPFYYAVFDVSPKERYRFIGGTVPDTLITEFKADVRRTIATLLEYNRSGEWPTVPSHSNCENCPIKKECPAFSFGSDIIRIW